MKSKSDWQGIVGITGRVSSEYRNGINLLFSNIGEARLYHYEGSYFCIEFSQNFNIESLKGKDVDFELITRK